MSNRLVPAPYFPIPPKEYDQRYFNEVIRAFSIYLDQARNPGEGRNTFTVFTALQQNDVGLEVGAVYRHGNDLKVVLPNTSAPAGTSGSGLVGSVTVVIT
jgi:hypothetical protein